jgi:hypothetical protein
MVSSVIYFLVNQGEIIRRPLPLVEQELLNLPGHMSSSRVSSGVRVAQSFVFCLLFCLSLLVPLSLVHLNIALSFFFD